VGLRAKTALILGGVVIALVTVLYLVLGGMNTEEYRRLEDEEVVRNLSRAASAIEEELETLETLILDWAVWDDAYEYARKPNQAFEDSKLSSTALGAIGLDRVVIRDASRTLATRQRLDTGVYEPTRESISSFINPRLWIWRHTRRFIVTSGLLSIDDRFFYVAQAPIIPSSKYRSPSGLLTMAMSLDEEALLDLAKLTQVDIRVYDSAAPNDPAFQSVVNRLRSGSEHVIEKLDDNRIAGYCLLSSLKDDSTLVLRAEMPRDVYNQGKRSNERLLLSLSLSGVAVFALALFLLERGLLFRVTRLRADLADIAERGDAGARVRVFGRDEIGSVAQYINNGLERIEVTQVSAARFEAELARLEAEELSSQMQRQSLSLEATRLELFERLALVAEFRDDETGQHTKRVGDIASAIGERMAMPKDETQRLRFAARLHDLGKIAIPDVILFKPEALNREEWSLMRTHAALGAQMLERSQSPLLEMAAEIALTHHERWDGEGYPRGLAGENIPLVGRIVAVADAFDAMISQRPYKAAWTQDQAIAEIERSAGTHFDPEVVRIFLDVMHARQNNLVR
jgi:sensor domain CHASE-containing protein